MRFPDRPRPPGHRAYQELHDERLRLAACRDAAFACGARSAVAWQQKGGPGPLTGRTASLPVADGDLMSELAAADLVMAGSAGAAHAYAAGVADGLRWAAGLAAEPPSLRAATVVS